MGYMCHHAIIVTSYDKDILVKTHAEIKKLIEEHYATPRVLRPIKFPSIQVTPVTRPVINGYCSFLIATDGSKEGWHESDMGDSCRDKIIELLDSKAFEDGSNSLTYAEVQYGDEAGNNLVMRTDQTHYKFVQLAARTKRSKKS